MEEANRERCNSPGIETERLLLRRFTEKDRKAVLDIFSDEETNIYLPWFPIKDLEDAHRFYKERYESEYRKPTGYYYAVCLKADHVPIGYVNLSDQEPYDLGYGLRTEFWHRGIITEACRAVVEQAEKDGLPYVTATHDVKNLRSGKVMRQLGMRYQYSYEEQWQPKDIPVTFRMYQLNLDGQADRVYRKYWEQADRKFVEHDLL